LPDERRDNLRWWGRRRCVRIFAITVCGEGGRILQSSKGVGGIILGEGLREFIDDSHRLSLLARAVAVLLLLAAAWSHD
jgi:hypothetical protein